MRAANPGADSTRSQVSSTESAFCTKDTVRIGNTATAPSGPTTTSESLLFDAIINLAKRYFPSQRLKCVELQMEDGQSIRLPTSDWDVADRR